MMMRTLVVVWFLMTVGTLTAADITLEQIISREDPAFQCERANLAVGRDGRVYVSSGGTPSYVISLDASGGGKSGAKVGYALTSATANAAGIVAVGNAHFSHRVALFDAALKEVASLEEFLVSDQVGWDAPGHVEAGAVDFYGLDQHRQRIVRLNAAGKLLTSYVIPKPDETPADPVRGFRVCEPLERFYVIGQSGAIRCIGFDGTMKWQVLSDVRSGDSLSKSGGFDVAADGTLYTLGHRADSVRRFAVADGKPLEPIKLQIDDIQAELAERYFFDLRVHGGEFFLRRKHPYELFRRYDLSNGVLKNAVNMDYERFLATLPTGVWTAGTFIPFAIRLETTSKASPPKWRIRGRTAGATDWQEFSHANDALQIPAETAGLYQIFVTPDVLAGSIPKPGDYRLQSWVEIRQPNSAGTVNVFSPDNRSHFGQGEEIPLSIVLRGKDRDEPVPVTVKLHQNEKVLATGTADIKVNGPAWELRLPRTLTVVLAQGDYTVTAAAENFTAVPQRVTIGPVVKPQAFHTIQYGDYGATYPQADVWSMPDVVADHAERTRKLGFDLLVDRLGDPNQSGATQNDRWKAELEPIRKRLELDPLATAPQKALIQTPMQQTLAAYSAQGTRQMAILMMNDAGLPLGGPGFDPRKPDQLVETLTRVTNFAAPYPAFRGWSWSSNWWIFQNRGAEAARSPEEKAAYIAAEKQARETGAWDKVLDDVSLARLSYAVDAQALFNDRLKQINPKLFTAVASPYRNVESYPPVTLSNVDEVDLQAQWEQVAVPYHAAFAVDYYKRPGKPAWIHPEIWNDAGTGDQILPTLFQALMRGADGIGTSGQVPSWSQIDGAIPSDPRSSHLGMTSIYRSVNGLAREYGQWLTTLKTHDSVAIVVSGRMMRTDTWGNVMGIYFARLMEAYCSCLHAHHPATIVFADDMTPDALKSFAAVLVIGQRVELEPKLLQALQQAEAANVALFRDGTSREELVPMCQPLGVAFDKFEKDPHPASDDAAYWRFAEYCRGHVPALKTAFQAVGVSAETDQPEVLLSERRADEGRFLFVINNTTPPHEPGQLWRVSLCVATRVPVAADVKLTAPRGAIYDVFAGRQVQPENGILKADLRTLPARILAVLPEPIRGVDLRAPQSVPAGRVFSWSVRVLGNSGAAVKTNIPVALRLKDSQGNLLSEQFVSVSKDGSAGHFTLPVNLFDNACTLDATELFSGQTSQAKIAVGEARLPLALETIPRDSHVEAPIAPTAAGQVAPSRWSSVDQKFGPHIRDLTVSADGSLAVANTMNWDQNLYGVELDTGKIRWRQRVGHYFAFAPQPLQNGIAVQGFDFHSAEGYHLYLANSEGKLERRFGLYGLPKRLPHKFVPGMLNDRINNFAVPISGDWIASAGDLGLAVWSREGRLLWQQDWWPDRRHTGLLTVLDESTLLVTEGTQVTAYAARSGERLWDHLLATTGEVREARASADGKTCAFSTTTSGGRVFLLRDGKLLSVLPTASSELAIDATGTIVAVVTGRQLKLFTTDGGLQWTLPADDTLHFPRFTQDGGRLAVSSELGTIYVLDRDGKIHLQRDTGNIAVPTWLANGDLLLGTWNGRVQRLDAQFVPRWTTALQPTVDNVRDTMLARIDVPTTRMTSWGNAEPVPAPVSPNLLDPKSVLIQFRAQSPHIHLLRQPDPLVDGDPQPPAAPWLSWGDVGNFAETSPFNYLLLDTYRTRLKLTGITLVEDPDHPESWLRDTVLESWDPVAEKWVTVQPLLSDAAIHTHKLSRPVEASRFRLVMPWGLCGNLRLSEIVFHGEMIGPSHPDAAEKRPVAVLFDESDELKETLVGNYHGTSFLFANAFRGGRCIRQEADKFAAPMFVPPFGHVVPTWDFEIVENPEPGQYRYAEFAWRALDPATRGVMVQFDGDAYGLAPRYFAGEQKQEDGNLPKQIASAPPTEWQVVRVDLWEQLKKPTRIRGLRLGTIGGPAAYDRIRLGRSLADLEKQE